MVATYCERVTAAFWAEPANAISSLAFLVAALGGWLTLRRQFDDRSPPIGLLVLEGLAVLIGLGSFLFHTVAGWTVVLDVVPISLFLLVAFTLLLKSFVVQRWGTALLGMAGFIVGVALIGTALGAVGLHDNGRWYLAAMLIFLGVGLLITLQRTGGRWYGTRVIGLAGVFGVALAFRELDQPLCRVVPSGTHFLWHLATAAVLYLLLRLLGRRYREVVEPAEHPAHELDTTAFKAVPGDDRALG